MTDFTYPSTPKKPRGATSFYDFSQDEEDQQPVAAAPQGEAANVAPAAPAAPVATAAPAAQTGNGNATPVTPAPQGGVLSMTGSNAPNFWQAQGQQPVKTTTQSGDASSSSSSSSTSTKTAWVSPYEPFKGDNLGDIADYIKAQMDNYKPETKEEREKREKREKRLDFLSRLRDGLSSFHTAYSYARGVKPMDLTMMSPRARELFERAKAQRDKDADRRLNLALVLQNLKDKDRAWKYQVTEAEQRQKNADRDFDYRKDRDKVGDDRWKQQFEYQQGRDKVGDDRWNKDYELRKQGLQEQKRHAKAMEGLQRAQHNFQKQLHDDSQYFTLGEGEGGVKVPKSAINSHNFSVVYNSLPKEYRQAQGTPIYSTDAFGKKVISGYNDPSAEAMAIAVGAFLGDQDISAEEKTVVRTALKQIGTPTGGNSRTMPGVK